jgi:uncharacterized membrane protein
MPRILLFAAYTIASHLSAVAATPWLQSASLIALVACLLYPFLKNGSIVAWLGFAAFAAVIAWIHPVLAFYLPYVLSFALQIAVLHVFASSLLPGRTPLASRIAAMVHGPLPPAIASYTRGVTWLWALIITGIMATSLFLVATGPRNLWSEFVNFYIYLIIAAVLLGEYAYRRVRFRMLEQPGFIEYLRLLTRRPLR